MERELEFLRQQVAYLERLLENCLAHISSLEARVAELERRPVVVLPPDTASEFIESTFSFGPARQDLDDLAAPLIGSWEVSRRRR